MAIISFDKSSVIDYVPAYGGNRESENPCIVKLKYVPYSRVQEYTRALSARIKGTGDASRHAEISQQVQRQQFVENVESVSGYYVNGAEVTTATEFYDTADGELIYEILRAMESAQKLSEGQRKN